MKMLDVCQKMLSGDYVIVDVCSQKVYSKLKKEEFLMQLKMFVKEEPYDESKLPYTNGTTVFFDNQSGNLVIGKMKRKKDNTFDKRQFNRIYLYGDKPKDLHRCCELIRQIDE